MLEFLAKLDSLERRIERALPADRTTSSRSPLADLPLLDFVPAVSPRLERPAHLAPIADLFERVGREEVRAVVSVPPQHGKTVTALHALVWMLQRDGAKRHAYVTYAADRAEDQSQAATWIAADAGLKVDGSRRRWMTAEQGGLIATGIGGPLTGYGIDGCMLVDDPVKNRAEAESATYRDRAYQWFSDVAMTRVHPGASVIVIQTRWHPDDLAGRLIAQGWETVNLQAINEHGEALWPERRPADWLQRQRETFGEYTWASLYQGQPRPRGGVVFRDAHVYESVPNGLRVSIGVDCAYTAKTHADYSVAVVLGEALGETYVVDVRRRQVSAPEFAAELRALASAYGNAPLHWYTSTTERGIADMLRGPPHNLNIRAHLAQADKFVRAQPVAAAWNAGKVLIPRSAPWLDAFVSEVVGFTGVGDRHDDQVDALAAGFLPFEANRAPLTFSENFPHLKRRM